MLGINLGRVLGREDWDDTKTQHRAIERQWHSHIVLLEYLWDCLKKALNRTLAGVLCQMGGSRREVRECRVFSRNGKMLSRGLIGGIGGSCSGGRRNKSSGDGGVAGWKMIYYKYSYKITAQSGKELEPQRLKPFLKRDRLSQR